MAMDATPQNAKNIFTKSHKHQTKKADIRKQILALHESCVVDDEMDDNTKETLTQMIADAAGTYQQRPRKR